MSLLRAALSHLGARWRVEQAASEVDAELLFHIKMRTLDNIDVGMTPEGAREDAMRRFGDFDEVKETCRTIKESGNMSRLKTWLWMAAGGGLAWWALSPENFGLRGAILEGSAVVILFCLFSSVRSIQRSRMPASVDGDTLTLLGEGIGYRRAQRLSLWNGDETDEWAAHLDDGPTPVERLLRDD